MGEDALRQLVRSKINTDDTTEIAALVAKAVDQSLAEMKLEIDAKKQFVSSLPPLQRSEPYQCILIETITWANHRTVIFSSHFVYMWLFFT